MVQSGLLNPQKELASEELVNIISLEVEIVLLVPIDRKDACILGLEVLHKRNICWTESL